MDKAIFKQVSDQLYCIDALYTAPDIACCYLLGSGEDWALIETGTNNSVPNILAVLKTLGIERTQLRYIIPTHVHLDHAGAAGTLIELSPNAELLIHPRGARHMINPQKLVASAVQVYGEQAFAALYGDIVPVAANRVRTLNDGEQLRLGSRQLTVAHTRGHADHHLCLFDETTEGWFSGDMFGISYPSQRFPSGSFLMPATTPTQFDPALYTSSVERLAARGPKRFYLTHFGELTFDPRQTEQLKRQLAAYAVLAGDPDLQGKDISNAVLEITRGELCSFVSDEEAATIAAKLKMDAQLNAEGIAWYRHSAETA